jgi:hypothetical protein
MHSCVTEYVKLTIFIINIFGGSKLCLFPPDIFGFPVPTMNKYDFPFFFTVSWMPDAAIKKIQLVDIRMFSEGKLLVSDFVLFALLCCSTR